LISFRWQALAATALQLLALASLVTFPACGGTNEATAGNIVRGTERLGWTQTATNANELSRYGYVAYVDGVRQTLTNATCQPTTDPAQFDCQAPLPSMARGAHRLELAAVILGSNVESPRSGPLDLVMIGNSTSAAAGTAASASVSGISRVEPEATRVAEDGTRFVVQTLSSDLDMTSALAATPDGRIFVAEASGIVRVLQAGALLPEAATRLVNAAKAADVGLVGMTLHPQFSLNHRVYFAYTVREVDGTFTNRVVRFTEVGESLGHAVVILEDRVAEPPQRTARLRFGPDRKLYVAFAAGQEGSAGREPASYTGKILRLNEDGTTPDDNPGHSPIVSGEHRFSGAFDWDPSSGQLLLSERDWENHDTLRIVSPGDRAIYSFDSVVDASAAAFYAGTSIAGFGNDMFIAALDGRHIRRVRFDPAIPARVISTERLLDGEFGRISDIAVAPDGALYFCTSNPRALDRRPGDELVRVSSAR
jgi:aldose sugar dehydrogenase